MMFRFFKIHRRMAVLTSLIHKGEQTSTELVDSTGLTWYAVTEALAWLLSQDLVDNRRLLSGPVVHFVRASPIKSTKESA